MNSGHPHLNSLWADLIVEELIRNGVNFFCLSPGSRSTPLAAAVATHPLAKSLMHFDERGAAFCALGYARAADRPAVLICTSGTAAANYFPAVVEAAADHVPMLVLTADRPPELRATGANQTIDQTRLFGSYPRWFFDFPCPDRAVSLRTVLSTIDQAVYRTLRHPAGPVHLNMMYREPLAPLGPEQDFSSLLGEIEPWRSASAPFTHYYAPTAVIEPARIEDASRIINASQHGVILVGREHHPKNHDAIRKVARTLQWPVLADIGSGLRLGDRDSLTVPCADQLLCADSFAAEHIPDTVLHFGPPLTSKRISQWLASACPGGYIHVADHPERQDPDHQITHRFDADIAMFCNFLLPFLTAAPNPAFRDDWQSASHSAETAIDRVLGESSVLTEPFIARALTRNIPPESCLFVASSMPIRDLDMFADPHGASVPVGMNRGASGIDGTLASAVGFALGHRKSCTLLIGDLALLHDLNSLAMLKHAPHPITIVLLNNDGGGIFHFLPIAERTDLFESFWGTPHGLTFEPAARLFGLDYVAPTSPVDFVSCYRDAQHSPRSTLIEVRTDRERNLLLHRTLSSAVADILSQ